MLTAYDAIAKSLNTSSLPHTAAWTQHETMRNKNSAQSSAKEPAMLSASTLPYNKESLQRKQGCSQSPPAEIEEIATQRKNVQEEGNICKVIPLSAHSNPKQPQTRSHASNWKQ